METENRNWKDNFMINESLHEDSQAIAGTYSRLRTKYPLHKDYDLWGRECQYWWDYKRSIGDMVLETEDIAELQVERLAKILRQAKLLEENLKKI